MAKVRAYTFVETKWKMLIKRSFFLCINRGNTIKIGYLKHTQKNNKRMIIIIKMIIQMIKDNVETGEERSREKSRN